MLASSERYGVARVKSTIQLVIARVFSRDCHHPNSVRKACCGKKSGRWTVSLHDEKRSSEI